MTNTNNLFAPISFCSWGGARDAAEDVADTTGHVALNSESVTVTAGTDGVNVEMEIDPQHCASCHSDPVTDNDSGGGDGGKD